MTGKSLAELGCQRCRLRIPLPGDGRRDRAALPARAQYRDGCGRLPEPAGRTGQQCLRPAGGYTKRVGQAAAFDAVPERQAEHLAIAIGQPVEGSRHDQQPLPPAHFGLDVGDRDVRGFGIGLRKTGRPGTGAGKPGLRGLVRGKPGVRGLSLASLSLASLSLASLSLRGLSLRSFSSKFRQALPASDGKDPAAEPIRVPQRANLGGGRDQRFLHGFLGCGAIAEKSRAVIE